MGFVLELLNNSLVILFPVMANLLVSDHSLFRTNRKFGSGDGYQFESIEIYKIARICGANIPGRM